MALRRAMSIMGRERSMPKTEVTSGCFERLKAISPVPVAMSRPGPVPCALPAARAAALFHRRCLPSVMVVLRKSYRRAIRENISLDVLGWGSRLGWHRFTGLQEEG